LIIKFSDSGNKLIKKRIQFGGSNSNITITFNEVSKFIQKLKEIHLELNDNNIKLQSPNNQISSCPQQEDAL